MADLPEDREMKMKFWRYAEKIYVEETSKILDYDRADRYDKSKKNNIYVKATVTNIINDNTDLVIENLIQTFANYKLKFIERLKIQDKNPK